MTYFVIHSDRRYESLPSGGTTVFVKQSAVTDGKMFLGVHPEGVGVCWVFTAFGGRLTAEDAVSAHMNRMLAAHPDGQHLGIYKN